MEANCRNPAPIHSLRQSQSAATLRGMWRQPYLETCCRAALHRLILSAELGRPPGLKDGPCLERLTEIGLAIQRGDGRFTFTKSGIARHASEILKLGEPAA